MIKTLSVRFLWIRRFGDAVRSERSGGEKRDGPLEPWLATIAKYVATRRRIYGEDVTYATPRQDHTKAEC